MMKVSKQDINRLLQCNDITNKYGLNLSKHEANMLVQNRINALKQNGRIEFKQGITADIIYEFCDSPYINKINYVDTVLELTQIFYYYKSECNDVLSDEELIKYMKHSFNGKCQGCLELLRDRELYNMLNNLKHGRDLYYNEQEPVEEDDYE